MFFLLRVFRLPILLAVAFFCGIYFERSRQAQSCVTSGGTWVYEGYCAGGFE